MTAAPHLSPDQAAGTSPAGSPEHATRTHSAGSPEHATSAEETECSRAGCREQAIWALHWRNPRIHAADRRKTWIACDEHIAYLREFLAARDFPLEVAALTARPV